MRGMKVTVDAAMRARDVSRPHAEQEVMARDNEPPSDVTRGRATAVAPEEAAPAAGADAPARAAAPDGPSKARRPHRRRRRR